MADKMVRCPQGHFFDPSKHAACPWCALPPEAGMGEKTRAVQAVAMDPPVGSMGPSMGPPPLPVAGNAPPPVGPPQVGPPQAGPPPVGPPVALAPPPASGVSGPAHTPVITPVTTPVSTPIPTPFAAPIPAPAAGSVTRRIGQETVGHGKVDPVVGWLVCLEGPDRGRDFRLHSEKNFIGRSPLMDVCIPNDDTVSREKHCVVVFDPKKQQFWVLPGESSGLVYLNGDIVHSPAQIQGDDTLEVGQTKLVLIPFCGEKYSWMPPGSATGG